MQQPSEDCSAAHTRARKLVNCIEFQLQQLEEQDAVRASAGGGEPGEGALADDDSMRHHAITENLNRLSSELNSFERAVAATYAGVAAASSKSDIWRK